MTGADLVFLGRTIWPFMATAALIGGLSGLAVWSARGPGWGTKLATGTAAVVTLGLWLVAGFELVPGRAGLALDLGAVLLAAFVAGALVGAGLARPFRRRSADWS